MNFCYHREIGAHEDFLFLLPTYWDAGYEDEHIFFPQVNYNVLGGKRGTSSRICEFQTIGKLAKALS